KERSPHWRFRSPRGDAPAFQAEALAPGRDSAQDRARAGSPGGNQCVSKLRGGTGRQYVQVIGNKLIAASRAGLQGKHDFSRAKKRHGDGGVNRRGNIAGETTWAS